MRSQHNPQQGHFYIADAKTVRACLTEGYFGDRKCYEAQRSHVEIGDRAWLYDRAEDVLHGGFIIEARPRVDRASASFARDFPLLTRVRRSRDSRLDGAAEQLRGVGVPFNGKLPGAQVVRVDLFSKVERLFRRGAVSGHADPSRFVAERLLKPSSDDDELEDQVADLLRFVGPLAVEQWGHLRPGESVPDGRATHGASPFVYEVKNGRPAIGELREQHIEGLEKYIRAAAHEWGRPFDCLIVCARPEKARQFASHEHRFRRASPMLDRVRCVSYEALLLAVVDFVARDRKGPDFDLLGQL